MSATTVRAEVWRSLPYWQRIFERVTTGRRRDALRERLKSDEAAQVALVAVYESAPFDVVRAYLSSLEER